MTLLQIITPVNIEEEREKFFSSTTYNPVFQYRWETEDVGKLYQSKKSDLKRAVLSQDHKEIVRCAKAYFETEIDEDIQQLAQEYTRQTPERISEKVEDLAEAFRKAFEFFDLDYKVILSERKGFNIRPEPKKQQIIISDSAELDFFSIDSEIKHEMTHVLRYENGCFNNIPNGKNYLPTEEGLACYMHDFYSHEGKSSLFQHAAEYIATKVGLNGSLRDIYNYLISIGFSEELAWQRSIRHKFGFKNTSEAGDIIKPAMYFYYEQRIQNLSEGEIWRLLVGKISISSLPQYPEYKGKYSLEKIQEFYKRNF